MHIIDRVYIDGQFVKPVGDAWTDLFNPATEATIGRAQLGDARDVDIAVSAAKRAWPAWRGTSKRERIAALRRLADALGAKRAALIEATKEEYGGVPWLIEFLADDASAAFSNAAEALENYEFTRVIGSAEVTMMPLGVVGAITPWNGNHSFLSSKIAMALAAGCTIVVKPSEMSAFQTQVYLEAMHAADVPAGIINVINGRGDTVGAALSAHPDIAKLTFTGSTTTGKAILKASANTMKRVTLELGGKSPTILLDDVDLTQAIPIAVVSGLVNSGQACVAGTRILVPETRMSETVAALKLAVEGLKVGPASDPDTQIGPMVSQEQFDRVQNYIDIGLSEGAKLLTGGLGRPAGLNKGWFVKPTVLVEVDNDMRVAREEIFGPVLSVLSYRDDEEAIGIANDTEYGLAAYVLGNDVDRAKRVAGRIEAGRVVINGAPHDPKVPFGGFKHSGIGREYGVFGLEAHLEPQAVMAP